MRLVLPEVQEFNKATAEAEKARTKYLSEAQAVLRSMLKEAIKVAEKKALAVLSARGMMEKPWSEEHRQIADEQLKAGILEYLGGAGR